jgi:two-component system, LuxR family, sensor histidine kinase DctS
MRASVPATQQSALTVPPQPDVSVLGRRLPMMPSLWAWPMLLSIVLLVAIMVWMQKSDRDEQEAQRTEMISDALSLEAHMTSWLDAEMLRLQTLAQGVSDEGLDAHSFTQHPMVLDGIRRLWISVTWIDARGRLVSQFPAGGGAQANLTDRGLTGHFSAPMKDGGSLIVRYASAQLLRQHVPWWLASKYDVRLMDIADNIVASTTEEIRREDRLWYRKSLGTTLPDVWLELMVRHTPKPWWQSLPMVIMAGFALLLALASWMLRRQMREVAKAEEAWRTEAAWRSAMEDSLAVGIRARDLEGRLVYVNKTMADMVGYAQDELIGAMPPMPYWPKDELESAMQRHLRNMAGRAPREGYESRWQHRNGQVLDVMVFEAPLVDARGQHIGWMASILNNTERRQMEERERKRADTMAHHARLTMLGEVASTLAHELNQPLSAIASYNAGLMNMVNQQPNADPVVQDALARMGEQAAHAGRIVRRIRDFLTRHEPQREPFDINRVVSTAVSLLQRDVARRKITVVTELPATLPRMMADPILIEQVVVNLIKNACDAVGAQPEPRRVLVQTKASSDGRFVKVSVTDNGVGLQGKTIEALCAPFYSTKSEGMGMGLAICRSIIELHCGALDAHDAPDGGAVFSFSVPCERMDEERAA